MLHGMNLLHSEIVKALHVYGVTAKWFLDIGCGDGSVTLLMAKTMDADEVYGADIDNLLLSRLPHPIKGVKYDFEKLNGSALPFAEEYFDAISAIEFIEHLSSGDELMREANKLLVPGGFFW
jgi:2-polyprenyl-3-methyl-5-hydroxy-6-metoxy-1,4-benzoquinol methylase